MWRIGESVISARGVSAPQGAIMVNINYITKVKKINQQEHDDYLRSQQRWQECTCRPQDALLCPSCLEYNKEKYGDKIYFEGSK